MANTSPVYARINTQLKENAEAVMWHFTLWITANSSSLS